MFVHQGLQREVRLIQIDKTYQVPVGDRGWSECEPTTHEKEQLPLVLKTLKI
jgi:hypothetical protein